MHATSRLLFVALALISSAGIIQAQYWQEDTTFAAALESGTQPVVYMTAAPAGKVFLWTSYAINGKLVHDTPRLINADGSIDPAFQPPMDSPTLVKASYPGNRVLVARPGLTNAGASTFSQLLRLSSDGSLDSTFTPAAFSDNYNVVVLSDGSILAYGAFSQVNGMDRPGLVLINADGSLSSTFAPTMTSSSLVSIWASLRQTDGKILVCGNPKTVGGVAVGQSLFRLNADGSLDSTFVPVPTSTSWQAQKLYAGPNGTVVVLLDGNRLVRLTASGSLDATYAAAPVGTVSSYGPQQPDGKIVYSTRNGSIAEIRRLNMDGTSESSFVVRPVITYYAETSVPVVSDDGTVYVMNPLTAARQASGVIISRVLPDGTLDGGFSVRPGSSIAPAALLALPGGKVVAVGNFAYVNNTPVTGTVLVRLNADGSTDSLLSSLAAGDYVSRLYAQPAGKILVSGRISGTNGTSHSLVRFNADGSRDQTFALDLPVAAVDAAGAIYCVSASDSKKLVRYTADGTLDSTFAYTPTNPISDVTPLTDGSVVTYQSEPTDTPYYDAHSYVKIAHDGSVDPGFHVSADQFLPGLMGEIATPDGGMLVFAAKSIQYGTYMQVWRIDSNGKVGDVYTSHQTNTNVFDQFLIPGGVLYDVLRGLNVPAGTILQGTLNGGASGWISVNTAGRLYLRTASSVADGVMHAYTPISNAGPTVDSSPEILMQYGFDSGVPIGGSASMQVLAGGLPVLTYQWYKDGVPLIGWNLSQLWISSMSSADAGDYSVVVSNAYGNVTSAAFHVTVDNNSKFVSVVQPPADASVAVGQTATFSVVADGTAPLTYQWRFNDQSIAGATSATLVIPNVTMAAAGNYSVRVANRISGYTTSAAKLTVTAFPLAGTYFGKAGAGDVAVTSRANGTADLLINLAATGRVIVAQGFAVGSDGSFTASGLSYLNDRTSPVGVTIAGVFSAGGVVSGSVLGDGLSFSGTKSSNAVATLYTASGIETNGGVVYAIADGINVVVGGTGGGTVFGGAGKLINGALQVASVGGVSVTVSVDSGAGAILATGTSGNIAGLSWGGNRSDIIRTDRLANISTRCEVGDDASALFAGFVISGSLPRPVLIRAVGPTLGKFDVSNPLMRPHLTIFRGQTVIGSSDDWGAWSNASVIAATADRVGAFGLPTDSHDAAVVATLAPGSYTASVTSRDATHGVALVEVYDAGGPGTATSQRLLNISSRGNVGTGENVMSAGFVVTGNAPKRVLIRGVGPTLAVFQVTGLVPDPVVTLRAGQTVLATNDDWETQTGDATPADIKSAGDAVGAFGLAANSKDSALLVTLLPGVYSATLTGKAGSSGIGLIEVYEIPAP